MKRIIFLATAALVAMMILVPTALAQDVSPGDDDPMLPEQNVAEVGSVEEITQMVQGLPKSGGPAVGSVLLPAAALLLGSGILTYAVLRRR